MDGASGVVTPFMGMSDVFSSQISRTPKEVVTTTSTSDLSFVQSLPEGEKMELVSELTHNMFKATSIFSLVSIS